MAAGMPAGRRCHVGSPRPSGDVTAGHLEYRGERGIHGAVAARFFIVRIR